jgi:hypothetical protein
MIRNQIRTILGCAILTGIGAAWMSAQQPASSAAVAGLPAEKGVYYRADANWQTLPRTLLWPYTQSSWRWILSVGSRRYVAQLPGEHSSMQVRDARPTFYIRGLAGNLSPRLVRFSPGRAMRSLPVRRTGNFFEPRVPFPEDFMRDVDVASVGNDTYSIRPRADLPAGEYAIVSSAVPDQRQTFFAFDFGVGGGSARP